MNKYLLYILMFFTTSTIFAKKDYNEDNTPEKVGFSIEAYKKGLEHEVTKHAGLTAQECEKLFPMMHEMLLKRKQLSDQQRTLYKDVFFKDLSEEECENIINKSFDFDIQINKLEKAYYKKFHTVISWKKVFKVRHAIMAYQMNAMHQFNRNKKKGPAPKGPGPRPM